MADIRKDLYGLEYSDKFDIAGIEEADINITLNISDETAATIVGTVTDGESPVEDATVKVFDKNGVPYKHTLTDSSGNYILDGLPIGSYSVGVAHNGYLMTVTKGVSLSDSDTVDIDFQMTVEETLSLGAIAGVLYAIGQGNSKRKLGNAKISLLNTSDEAIAVTYSADDGEFAFYDLDDGQYTVICSSDGYLSSTPMIINITNGSISNIELSLQIDARTYNGTVSGYIKDTNGNIISGCFVGLYKITDDDDNNGVKKETLISTSKTNASGLYLFGGVVEGNYMVKSKMNK